MESQLRRLSINGNQEGKCQQLQILLDTDKLLTVHYNNIDVAKCKRGMRAGYAQCRGCRVILWW